MATKPSSPFEWSTSVAVGDDDTQRLDFTVETPAWVTDGAADDDVFKHEYANDVFGRISDWIVYLDELVLSQIPYGTNGAIKEVADDTSDVILYAQHDTGGGEITFRVEGQLWADKEVRIGGSPISTDHIKLLGRQTAATTPTYLLEVETEGGTAVSGAGVDEVSLQVPVVTVGQEVASASADLLSQAPQGASLYLDNLVKAHCTVVINTTGSGVLGLTSVGGTNGYNVETPVRMDGASILVDVSDTTGIIGHVQACARESLVTSDLGLLRWNAAYDATESAIRLTLQGTTQADITTFEPFVASGAINTGASFDSEVRIDVILF